MELGKNPDMAPFSLFALDAIAAMSGNLLFLSSNDVSSVLAIIAIDMVENFWMASRVVFLLQDADRAKMRREMRRRDDEWISQR